MGWGRRLLIGTGAVAGLGVVGGAVAIVYASGSAQERLRFPETPKPALTASQDPEVIARGKYLVHGPAHCASCHCTGEREHPEQILTAPLSGGLEFAMGPIGTRYARNLTPDVDTGIGARTDAELARTLRTGVLHDGELSFLMYLAAAVPADEDIVAIISYLRTLPPVKHSVPPGSWGILGKVLITYAFPPLHPHDGAKVAYAPPSDEPSLARGAYVTEQLAMCTNCHTAFDVATLAASGPKAGGSLPDPSHGKDTDKEFVAPNLTSHPTGVTGKLDEATFLARMRAKRVHTSSIMPWENFSNTTDADLRSVYRYLKSLPPVDNDVGPTYRDAGWKRP